MRPSSQTLRAAENWGKKDSRRSEGDVGILSVVEYQSFELTKSQLAEEAPGGDQQNREEIDRMLKRQLAADTPLGFGGQGLLVSFSDNCPNNTLPPFWCSGEVAGKRWVPLLPRRQIEN